jgi:hypothetical protein
LGTNIAVAGVTSNLRPRMVQRTSCSMKCQQATTEKVHVIEGGEGRRLTNVQPPGPMNRIDIVIHHNSDEPCGCT